jgi:hypothetical protein
MGGQLNLLIVEMTYFQIPSLVLEGIQPSQAISQLWVQLYVWMKMGMEEVQCCLEWVSNLLEEGTHAICHSSV